MWVSHEAVVGMVAILGEILLHVVGDALRLLYRAFIGMKEEGLGKVVQAT